MTPTPSRPQLDLAGVKASAKAGYVEPATALALLDELEAAREQEQVTLELVRLRYGDTEAEALRSTLQALRSPQAAQP